MKESKKEALIQFHRSNIIRAAEKLFLEKGIESTTMDSISKEADYSKATLYVYFKNKEEIIGELTLISMKLLHQTFIKATSDARDCYDQYYAFCYALMDFQQNHPIYYQCLLREINVDLDLPKTPNVYQEIYNVGEDINEVIGSILEKGIAQGYIRGDINIFQTVFILWASISGVIDMATQKEKYFLKCNGITKDAFLKYSFDTILKSILV